VTVLLLHLYTILSSGCQHRHSKDIETIVVSEIHTSLEAVPAVVLYSTNGKVGCIVPFPIALVPSCAPIVYWHIYRRVASLLLHSAVQVSCPVKSRITEIGGPTCFSEPENWIYF